MSARTRTLAWPLLLIATLAVGAQMRVVPLDDEEGHVRLGLALRHLANTGVLLETTAHPDDENNGLLVLLNRGQGYRTALATATRGNGGQNEIGPEIFEALGILRTEELAALHRFDGAEQYFTRAVDFGFSFSIDETFEKWGRSEITADFVRLIRTIRPDVVIAMSPAGSGGGQHHQASAALTRDAVRISGDPTKYPEQIAQGLRPWQPQKFYFSTGFGAGADQGAGTTRINLSAYDPLLGKTYAEIGTEARSMHKCQGMAQLLALPGPASTSYRMADTTVPGALQRDERGLFDGIDTSIPGLARFAGDHPPPELGRQLDTIASAVRDAQTQLDGAHDQATLSPLLAGLEAVRALRARLGTLAVDTGAREEIDDRLSLKEREFQDAILTAAAIRLEALGDAGVVVPGQSVTVSVIAANRGPADVTVKQVAFEGFEPGGVCALAPVGPGDGGGRGGRGGGRGADAAGRSVGATSPSAAAAMSTDQPAAPISPISTLARDMVARCSPTLKIPRDARVSEPYWHRAGQAGRYTFDPDAPFGLPYRPTPFAATVVLAFEGGRLERGGNPRPVMKDRGGNPRPVMKDRGGNPRPVMKDRGGNPRRAIDVVARLPVQHRYQGDIFSGEKRMDLLVTPAISVRVEPEIAIVPAEARERAAIDLRVTVLNDAPAASGAVVRLELPGGWTAAPSEQSVSLGRAGDADGAKTARFQLRPASDVPSGEYRVRAIALQDQQRFTRGYQVIEYPHIRRQHIFHDAETRLKVVDVRTVPNLTVGYVVGVGDEVPAAIEQLGAKVEYLGPDDLAWGDLSRLDAIVTGVRAYERRHDLRANNRRLLDYVRGGGTLIVQYNKFEFNQAQYGPYAAVVSSNRVTDERSPVTVLVPDDPVVNFPNRLTEWTWQGWVQERGLYFLGQRDARYRDLVRLEDPFPNNPGEKLGALVEARYGTGRWLYVGLGLWRQLPAGTDGAYQILANLISLRRAPQGEHGKDEG